MSTGKYTMYQSSENELTVKLLADEPESSPSLAKKMKSMLAVVLCDYNMGIGGVDDLINGLQAAIDENDV